MCMVSHLWLQFVPLQVDGGFASSTAAIHPDLYYTNVLWLFELFPATSCEIAIAKTFKSIEQIN